MTAMYAMSADQCWVTNRCLKHMHRKDRHWCLQRLINRLSIGNIMNSNDGFDWGQQWQCNVCLHVSMLMMFPMDRCHHYHHCHQMSSFDIWYEIIAEVMPNSRREINLFWEKECSNETNCVFIWMGTKVDTIKVGAYEKWVYFCSLSPERSVFCALMAPH